MGTKHPIPIAYLSLENNLLLLNCTINIVRAELAGLLSTWWRVECCQRERSRFNEPLFFFFWRLFGVKDVGERRKIRETVLGKAREKMRKKKEIMEKMEKK